MYRLTHLNDLLVTANLFAKTREGAVSCRIPLMRMLVVLCSLTYYTVAKESDSVPFKPRDYTPSKTLRSNAYAPKAYAPKPTTPSAQFEGKATENQTLSAVSPLSEKTLEPTTPFTGKSADKQSATEAKTYTQGDADFPSTISIDQTFSSQEKKSFLVSSNDSPFIITERPKEKNPLLEPRQGIKAPEETTPTKDPTK
jgi:hypothetical protein